MIVWHINCIFNENHVSIRIHDPCYSGKSRGHLEPPVFSACDVTLYLCAISDWKFSNLVIFKAQMKEIDLQFA